MDTPRFRATALFVSLAMLTATGLALAPAGSADHLDIEKDCISQEESRDDVWVDVCYELHAHADIQEDGLRVSEVELVEENIQGDGLWASEVEPLEEAPPVDETGLDTGERCPAVTCIPGQDENVTVLRPTLPEYIISAVEVNRVNVDLGDTGPLVFPDRACEDNGFEEGCPGPEELPGPGDLPDPSDFLEDMPEPGSSGSSGPAITHLADADDDGTFDGVIVETDLGNDYYLGHDQVAELLE